MASYPTSLPVTPQARAAYHMLTIVYMVRAGIRADTIAYFVRCLRPEDGGVIISHRIEDLAMPGTLAEQIFNILAD